MWGTVASYAFNHTNYGIVNTNNIYNHMFHTMESLSDEQNEKFIENMKIDIGMTFYNNFRIYVLTKSATTKLIKFFT